MVSVIHLSITTLSFLVFCEEREGQEVKRLREKLEQNKRNEVKQRERGNNVNRWRKNTDGFGLII